MPYTKLTFRPGIDQEQTQTLNEGGWTDCSLVRFRSGQAQSMGGWLPVTPNVLSGACRYIHDWSQLNGELLAAFGTSLQLALLKGGLLSDITPVRASGTLDPNPFSLTPGVIIVTHPGNGVQVGDQVIFGSAVVGGFAIGGQYTVATVVSASVYTVGWSGATTTVAAGGGSGISFTYLMAVGNADAQNAFGWGAGGWGTGSWGTARVSTSKVFPPRIWSIDNWGEELVAVAGEAGPAGVSGVFNWKPSDGTNVRAHAIPNAPQVGHSLLTGLPERHLIVFGADVAGVQDPLLIRFSDTEDYTVWVATSLNAAGSFRLQGGTKIVAAKSAAGQILVLTDILLYGMRFVGQPYIYSFDVLGRECGGISPNCMVTLNSVAFWMSHDGFFTYTGQVQTLPCTVWTRVFSDLNEMQKGKIFAAVNTQFGEVWWFYASTNSTECDRYVVYNASDEIWYLGSLSRTFWLNASVFDTALSTDMTGAILSQETGTEAAGQPLPTTITSGYIDLSDGQEFMFVDRIIPDFDVDGQIQVYLTATDAPGFTPHSYGPFTVTSATTEIPVRIRCRQISWTVASNTVGARWKQGAVRVRVRPDGRR